MLGQQNPNYVSLVEICGTCTMFPVPEIKISLKQCPQGLKAMESSNSYISASFYNWVLLLRTLYFVDIKGQLISKGLVGILNSPKNDLQYCKVDFSFVFWEN